MLTHGSPYEGWRQGPADAFSNLRPGGSISELLMAAVAMDQATILQEIRKIQADESLTDAEKAKKRQELLSGGWKLAASASQGSQAEGECLSVISKQINGGKHDVPDCRASLRSVALRSCCYIVVSSTRCQIWTVSQAPETLLSITI